VTRRRVDLPGYGMLREPLEEPAVCAHCGEAAAWRKGLCHDCYCAGQEDADADRRGSKP
jgi:hypothetical protein